MQYNDLKQTLWFYMISKGVLVCKLDPDEEAWTFTSNDRDYWDYYGGYPRVQYSSVVDFVSNNSLIDWNKTLNPTDRTFTEFNGTEQPSTKVPTLVGTLCMVDGSRYCWVIIFDMEISNIFSLLQLVKDFETKNELEVLNSIKKKFQQIIDKTDKKYDGKHLTPYEQELSKNNHMSIEFRYCFDK